MSILALESFSGADANPIGGNWTTCKSGSGPGLMFALQRISNCVDGTSGDSAAYNNTTTAPNDQYATVTSSGGTAGMTTDGGPIIRVSTTAQTWYLLDLPYFQLFKTVAGVFTVIGSAGSATIADGDRCSLTIVGTALAGLLNGTTECSTTDSAIGSGGKFGIFISGTSCRFSAFEGGDFQVQDPVLNHAQTTVQQQIIIGFAQ